MQMTSRKKEREGKVNERATAVLDFPRMRAGRDKTRTLFVEGCETPNWGEGEGTLARCCWPWWLSAPHRAQKVGNASVSGVSRDRESDRACFHAAPVREHMQPLRRFMDNRSRPLIKPNITSEGLSKLLREMN